MDERHTPDELTIAVTAAAVEPHAAVPTIVFSASASAPAPVHSIALRTQIMIEPQRRRYDPTEEERLLELFGETPQWGDSLRPFLWTHVDTMVAGFDRSGDFRLPVTCTYDFEVAGAKFLHALGSGDVPLLFLFSGTTFRHGAAGFEASMVPWHLESRFRLPVATWRETMDRYFPNAGWLRLSRASLDRLQRFRAGRALPTWEQAIETLLKEAGEE
ncbi:MAG: DUF6084 family protein [Acidimicrobiales bacterium]